MHKQKRKQCNKDALNKAYRIAKNGTVLVGVARTYKIQTEGAIV